MNNINIFDDMFQDIKKTKRTTTKSDFISDYYVYTDGACLNNGKLNAFAGIGIFFGVNDPRNVSKNITGKQSNNVAELTAIKDVYDIIKKDLALNKKITIVTDSEYALKCVTTYGMKCHKKNWNVDIPNKELVRSTYELYKNNKNVNFICVKAHTEKTDLHSIGNNGADKLANLAIGLTHCPYNQNTKLT